MGHNGSENFKTLLLLHMTAKSFKLVLNIPPMVITKLCWGFLHFEIMIINDFAFKYFKFTIVPYGETQSSIIWKMSDLTAKRSEIAIP